MKTKKKVILIVLGIIVALAIVGFSVTQTQKSLVTVQTGKVMKQDIASYVTASGEIKPKLQVNVGANAFGRITRLFVKEGEHVKRGQILVQLENVQSASDVAAAKATLSSNETDAVAAEANLRTLMATLNSSKADLARAKLDYTALKVCTKTSSFPKPITTPRRRRTKWPWQPRRRTRHAWPRPKLSLIPRRDTSPQLKPSSPVAVTCSARPATRRRLTVLSLICQYMKAKPLSLAFRTRRAAL